MLTSLLEKYSPRFAPEGNSGGGGDGGGVSGGSAGSDSSSAPSTPSSSPSTPSATPTVSSPPSAAPSVATPSTPPSASPAAAPASAPGEAFDFSSIFQDQPDESSAAAQATPPKPPEVPPEVPAAAPPAAPPKAAEAAPVAPSAPVPATPQTPSATPTEFDRYDPAMLSQHLAGNEAQALDYVAQNMFKLSPEEVEALETNVIDAVPKLLAKVFVKSQQNVLMQLASIVPVMMQRQTVAMQRNSDNQEKFYARWPQVEKAKHGDLVTKYAAVYRQMHPTAGLDQMIEDLGPMVMMAGRINPGIPVAGTAAAAVNPAAQRAANGRPPPPTPFVPAGNMAPAMASTTPEISPWEAMFRQDE